MFETTCREMIISHMEDSIFDEGSAWRNEYGGIDRDNELPKKLVRFHSSDDFEVIMMSHTDSGALFFKILPAKMPKRMIPFTSTETTKNWDGYFIDVERNPGRTLPEKTQMITELNQACATKSTVMVNGWGMDSEENRVRMTPRLEMYLS